VSHENASSNTSSPYRRSKEQSQDLLIAEVMRLASDILAREGASGISMRRLAQAAGCSTTVLYHLFGSKNGIVEALFIEGFERLQAAQSALLPQPDPRQHIIALCRSYRQTALENPTHYAIMFGNAIPDFEPSLETRQRALQSMQALMQAVEAAWQAGVLNITNSSDFGMMLWSAAHGFVSLELVGMSLAPERAAELYDSVIERLLGETQ